LPRTIAVAAGDVLKNDRSLGVAVLAATVVYQYAVTGEAPGGFDRQMLLSAFARR